MRMKSTLLPESLVELADIALSNKAVKDFSPVSWSTHILAISSRRWLEDINLRILQYGNLVLRDGDVYAARRRLLGSGVYTPLPSISHA
jgi:hypothetical protein